MKRVEEAAAAGGGLGVFGGTFDPLHIGHLIAAQEVREALSLERILFVPARRSPLKEEPPRAPPSARLRMLRDALAANTHFEVDDIEIGREGASYTVDTLRSLAGRYPGTRIVLILGADQWAQFARWREPREIASLGELALMTRGGESPGQLDAGLRDGPPPPFVEIPITRMDLSSSLVRRRIREGRSVRHLVPDAVRRIIEADGLYLMDAADE